jgi:hypothetical protein
MGEGMSAMFPELGYWLSTKDGDPRASALYAKHYSARQYADQRRRYGYANQHLICGPGQKILLIGNDERAIFAWRKFKDDSGQVGINNAIFRNESPHRSSDLVREAVEIAWRRWPGERLYTYISTKVQSGRPGYCFEKAGWRYCGRTKVNKLLIFEITPNRIFMSPL